MDQKEETASTLTSCGEEDCLTQVGRPDENGPAMFWSRDNPVASGVARATILRMRIVNLDDADSWIFCDCENGRYSCSRDCSSVDDCNIHSRVLNL